MTKRNRKNNKNNKEKCRNPFKDFLTVVSLTVVVIIIGTIGFYMYHRADWINAFYNSVLVLTTIGTPEEHNTTEAMLFTAFYGMFSCLFFIFIVGFFVSSWISTVRIC